MNVIVEEIDGCCKYAVVRCGSISMQMTMSIGLGVVKDGVPNKGMFIDVLDLLIWIASVALLSQYPCTDFTALPSINSVLILCYMNCYAIVGVTSYHCTLPARLAMLIWTLLCRHHQIFAWDLVNARCSFCHLGCMTSH